MVKKFAFFYLLTDVFLIAFSLYMGGYWLINTQCAFILSMLITYSSFYGYKSMILKKSEMLDRDILEEDEDKDIIKETKKSVGTFGVNVAIMRFVTYSFLILTFFFLNRHGWFMAIPFILGVSIVPLVSLFLSLRK